MWVHPDLIKDQHWTVGNRKKAKGKSKASSCNMIGVSTVEKETNVASLTDSEEEEEEFIFNTEPEIPPVGTQSGRQFSKNYDETVAGSSEPKGKAVEQPLKKHKELRFSKPLHKESEGTLSTPFQFNVMA